MPAIQKPLRRVPQEIGLWFLDPAEDRAQGRTSAARPIGVRRSEWTESLRYCPNRAAAVADWKVFLGDSAQDGKKLSQFAHARSNLIDDRRGTYPRSLRY